MTAWAVVLFGGVLAIGSGAGCADVLKHGHRSIGDGVTVDRFIDSDCHRRTCARLESVHVTVLRADAPARLHSRELYDLVGAPPRRLPVALEVDTFSDHISRVRVNGRWVNVDQPGKGWLIALVPLFLIGSLLVLSQVPVILLARRKIPTRRRTVWKLAWIVGGTLVAALAILVTVVGLTGDDDAYYTVHGGTLQAQYATVSEGNIYREGVVVHGADGSNQRVQSHTLYDLVERNGGKPVALAQIGEDANSKATSVTLSSGKTYDFSDPAWYVLVFMIPLLIATLDRVAVNAIALRRAM